MRKLPRIQSLRGVLPRRHLLFETGDLTTGVGRRTTRGTASTLAATFVSVVLLAVSTVVVTRYLGKEEFGVMGMVTVVTGFMAVFTGFGIARAIVQRNEVTEPQAVVLFWVNIAIGGLAAAVSASLAPVLVAINDEPRVFWVHVAASSLFLIGSFATVPRALLTRRLEFAWLNLTSVATALATAAAGVLAASRGAGVWTLVLMPLAGQVTALGMVWIGCRWRPGRLRRGTGAMDHLRFGGNVLLFQGVNYVARSADNAMLGYAWGAGPLGLYIRAYSLMMLPPSRFNEPLGSVIVPVLSRVASDPLRYRRIYLAAISLQSLILVPLTVGVALVAEDLLPGLLGGQWSEIVPIYWALTPACVLAATNTATGWLYLSCGHVDRQLRFAVFQTPIIVAAMCIGLQWSAMGLGIAVSVVYTLMYPIGFHYASRGTPVRTRAFLCSAGVPILLSVAAAAVAWPAGDRLAAWSPGPAGVSRLLVYLLCLAGLAVLTGYHRRTGAQAALVWASFRKKKPAGAAAAG